MEWQEVVDSGKFIGGDIETQEGGSVYRGPIKSITIDDYGMVRFENEWMAAMTPGEGTWRKWDITTSSVNGNEIKPQEISNGRIMCMMPTMGPMVLFPNGGSQLDPAKVEGLDL